MFNNLLKLFILIYGKQFNHTVYLHYIITLYNNNVDFIFVL